MKIVLVILHEVWEGWWWEKQSLKLLVFGVYLLWGGRPCHMKLFLNLYHNNLTHVTQVLEDCMKSVVQAWPASIKEIQSNISKQLLLTLLKISFPFISQLRKTIIILTEQHIIVQCCEVLSETIILDFRNLKRTFP